MTTEVDWSTERATRTPGVSLYSVAMQMLSWTRVGSTSRVSVQRAKTVSTLLEGICNSTDVPMKTQATQTEPVAASKEKTRYARLACRNTHGRCKGRAR